MPLDPPPALLAIRFHDLQLLVVLVEELHVERAAKRLWMTSSELSAAIRRLEDRLAVPLATDHSPEVTVTEAGRRFAEHARMLLAGLRIAAAEARRAGKLHAPLRLGCAPDFPLQTLQSFLGLLYADDPLLHVEVNHLRSAEQLERLRIGELDLGLIRGIGADGVVEWPMPAGERVFGFLAHGHRLEGAPALAPGDLQGDVLLVSPRDADAALEDRIMALLDESGHRFRDVREVGAGDPRDLLFAVAESRGVAVGPRSLLEAAGAIGTLVTASPLEPPLLMPGFRLAWRPDPLPELARVLAAARRAADRLFR
jgi:DNA-binding transcriptional LysR family regulator